MSHKRIVSSAIFCAKIAPVILLDLAGWRFRLDCSPTWLADAVAARYAPFRASSNGAPDDFRITVSAKEEVVAGSDPHYMTLLDAQLKEVLNNYLLDEPGICGRIDRVKRHASLTLNSGESLQEVEYFLRVACAVFVYFDRGLLVHGAALLEGQQAHVFIGPSGSGKSTIVALSPHHIALGDDLILLRQGRSGWTAHGTPFWNLSATNRNGQNACGTVAAIYSLTKSDRASVEELPLAAAVSELAVSSPVVNGIPTHLPGLLARCHELAANVPVRELRFRKDASFWEAIRDSAAGRHTRQDMG
jgi:hypothetical protein